MARKKKHPILGVIIALFVLIIIIGALGGGDKDKPEKTAETAPEPVVAEEVAEAPTEEPAEEPAAEEPAEEPTPDEEPAEAPADGISPELKDFLDSYEAFMDEYCDFMASFNSSDASALLQYSILMGKYADFSKKADEWNSREMNDAETLYYVQVMNRVNEKLLKVSSGL
jgi:hypothetical protein